MGCKTDECKARHYAKGLCRKHYNQQRYYNSLGKTPVLTKEICNTAQVVIQPKERGWAYLAAYNLTHKDYLWMLEAQGGGCAGCGSGPSGRSTRLCVDHDHACCPGNTSCGKCVRGLLCDPCNRALGAVRDDADRLLALAIYVLQGRDVVGKI